MKTTFVLGAAANIGIDNTGQFPLGSQLAIQIQNQLASELNDQSILPNGHIGASLSCSGGGLTDGHVEAMRRIENSIVFKDSIDDLVEEWSDLKYLPDVAKVCIAVEILKSESTTQICAAFQSTIRPSSAMRNIRDSWLGQLLRYANPNARRRDVRNCLKNIRFITFNYDRCLEAALLTFLHFGQNIPLEECVDIIDSIEIHHAYGCLGRLPQLGGNLTFGSIQSRDIYLASTQIKTYSEELESGHTEKIRNVISDSDNLIFLGFGFHDQNLKILFDKKNNLFGSSNIYATTVGMNPNNLNRVRDYFRGSVNKIDLREASCHHLIEAIRNDIF